MRISCSEKGRQDFEFVIPFAIHRQEHVSLGSEESPIPIVDAGVHCYVPKGLVRLGGDDYALNGLTGNKYDIRWICDEKTSRNRSGVYRISK